MSGSVYSYARQHAAPRAEPDEGQVAPREHSGGGELLPPGTEN